MHLSAMNVSVERGGRRVVEGISFALWPGEALVITGPNGAGKSTLLRCLAGLLPHASGTIERPGDDENSNTLIHYVGHAESLKASLTAVENLEFWSAMLGTRAKGLTPEEALKRFGLNHIADLPASYLSAGQKRRVSLARLLVACRMLWLLDEPLTALDVGSQKVLTQLMDEHLESGGMIIAATHAPLDLKNIREMQLGRAA